MEPTGVPAGGLPLPGPGGDPPEYLVAPEYVVRAWSATAYSGGTRYSGGAGGRSRAGAGRSARERLGVRDRVRPFVSALGSSLVGDRLVALHMTWGAVNEWTTQAGYVRLAQRAGHPTLTELTRRIARQEGRHIDFYAAEARRRLASSQAGPTPRAVVAAPPLAAGGLGDHAAGGDGLRHRPPLRRADGAPFVERIDRRIDALPGLAACSSSPASWASASSPQRSRRAVARARGAHRAPATPAGGSAGRRSAPPRGRSRRSRPRRRRRVSR